MGSSKSMPQSKFLKRFRFGLLSYFRFLFISCPRVRFEVTTKRFRLSNKSFVSVGQGSAQGTPSSSPEKIYTPLKVATPDPLKPTLVGESPIEASLQIVDDATEKASSNPGPPGSPSERREQSVPSEECQLTGTSPIITNSSVTTKPMEAPLGDFAQVSFGVSNPPGISQTPTPTFNKLTQEEGSYLLVQGSSSTPTPSDPNIQDQLENPTIAGIFPNEAVYPVATLPSLSITRQEILVFSSVLDRIPSHSLLEMIPIPTNL